MQRSLTVVFWISVFFLNQAAGALERQNLEENSFNGNTSIKVLLGKGQRKVSINSPLGFTFIKSDADANWVRQKAQLQIKVSKNQGKLALFVDGAPQPGNTVIVRGGPLPTEKLQVQDRFYRGAIRLTLHDGAILMVNELGLEDYLIGLIAAEMSPHWEIEALKAQAVASRTYALYMKNHPRNEFYDVEKGTQDQVYDGAASELPRAIQAVHSTRGEYIGKGRVPIKAFFHSRCGGYTETSKSVWNHRAVGTQSRIYCPYCQKHPYVWQAKVAVSELRGILGKLIEPLRPIRLALAEKSPSGRVSSIEVKSGDRETKISSDEFRNLFGYSRIKSTFFSWKWNDNYIAFEGVGAGHGVGMCQWGARYLAQKGRTYQEILRHYYPDFVLNKI